MKTLRGNQLFYLILLVVELASLALLIVLSHLVTGQQAHSFKTSPRHIIDPIVVLALFVTDRFKFFYLNLILLTCCAVFFTAEIPIAFMKDEFSFLSVLDGAGHAFLVVLIVVLFMHYPYEILKRSGKLLKKTSE